MPDFGLITFRSSTSTKAQAAFRDTGHVNLFPLSRQTNHRNYIRFISMKPVFAGGLGCVKLTRRFIQYRIRCAENCSVPGENEDSSIIDEDDENCPVDCVREFKTDEEFSKILAKAKQSGSLIVVDFYRTSCGSCKYIEHGFIKLCKGSGDQENEVIFLKHNVIDEYDERTEVAERLRIRSVPLFHFYKEGILLEAFPTRDKERILAAIRKYTSVVL